MPDLSIRFHVFIVPRMPTSPFDSFGRVKLDHLPSSSHCRLHLDYSPPNSPGQLHYLPWNSLVELKHPFELNWGELSRPEGLPNEVWKFLKPMEDKIWAMIVERGGVDHAKFHWNQFTM